MRESRGNRIGQTGRIRSRARLHVLPLLPLALILLCSLGCPSTNRLTNNTKNEDPLLGGYKPKATTTTETKSPVPPIPQANSSMSNAAMATALPLDGGRPLLIPDNDAKPLNDNSLSHAAGPGNNSPWTTQTGTNSQKPILGPPQPISKGESKNVPAVTMQGNTPPLQGGE